MIGQKLKEAKVHRRTVHEVPEVGQRYSSTLSLTPALDGGGWLTPRPGRFNHGKVPVPILQYRRLGGPRDQSGRVRNISPPPNSDPRTVRPAASRYAEWAVMEERRKATYAKFFDKNNSVVKLCNCDPDRVITLHHSITRCRYFKTCW
jgi:hypothetical protein